MFDKLLQASLWRHDSLRLLGQSDLLTFQLFDALFICPDHRRARRINNAVQQRCDLLLGIPKLNLSGLFRDLGLTQPRFPRINEHGSGDRIELLRRLQRAQDRLRAFLDFRARDRLALRGTIRRVAQIVGIVLVTPLRPARGQCLVAIIAEQMAAPDEVLVDVLACKSEYCAVKPRKDALVSLETDQWLMMPLTKRHTPVRVFNAACTGYAFQNLFHFGDSDRTVLRTFGKLGLRLEKPLHFSLRT